MAEKKCAHPECKCRVPEGKTYCSDHCRDHGADEKGKCGCGHPACS
jgi:hypothetical protein